MASEVTVAWIELTPQAQAAMVAELEELLALAPNQDTVPVVRAMLERKPEMIPHTLQSLRERLR